MTLLADAIRGMGNEALLRAFERQHLSADARALIRAELLQRLRVLEAIGEMAPNVDTSRRT